jgi:transcription elongation factor GreA-like protein
MISDLMNEEKWTRATLNSYTINNFKELDTLIEQTISEEIQSEVKTLCDEHLSHTKNSIIALYISGILALSRQMLDDSNLLNLINIFQDNHKWNVVEFLCLRMLEFGENKFALRILADCYDSENESDKKYEIWERLVKVDYEEADIVRLLAERKESAGDKEGTVVYYKRAIHRYLNKKLFANVKDIWNKLIEYSPDDVDFFFYVEKKVAKSLTDERASQLLEDLYAVLKKEKRWDRAIDVLKRMLEYDSKNTFPRKEIIACYREKFSYNSQLEEYIKVSNLNQGWRNVHEAIEDFEKHISFDAGNFVFHRSWGIGRIASIKNDMIVIDFARKRGHEMSLKMAVSALTSLSKDHIWVLKTIWPKEKPRTRSFRTPPGRSRRSSPVQKTGRASRKSRQSSPLLCSPPRSGPLGALRRDGYSKPTLTSGLSQTRTSSTSSGRSRYPSRRRPLIVSRLKRISLHATRSLPNSSTTQIPSPSTSGRCSPFSPPSLSRETRRTNSLSRATSS